MIEIYPLDNEEIVKDELADSSQVVKYDYNPIDGKIHATVPDPSSTEKYKQKIIFLMFSLTDKIDKLRKCTNDELEDIIKEDEYIDNEIGDDDSKGHTYLYIAKPHLK